jgi:hypothetical protein
MAVACPQLNGSIVRLLKLHFYALCLASVKGRSRAETG